MQFFAIYYRNESSKCTVLPEVHHVNESSILENSSIYSGREREKNCSFYDNTTASHRAPKRSVNRSNYPALCCSSILVPIVVGGWRIGYSKPEFLGLKVPGRNWVFGKLGKVFLYFLSKFWLIIFQSRTHWRRCEIIKYTYNLEKIEEKPCSTCLKTHFSDDYVYPKIRFRVPGPSLVLLSGLLPPTTLQMGQVNYNRPSPHHKGRW